jgi:hypothetical protein
MLKTGLFCLALIWRNFNKLNHATKEIFFYTINGLREKKLFIQWNTLFAFSLISDGTTEKV